MTSKEYYRKNKEEQREYNRKYYKEHKEKIAERNKIYYSNNREKKINQKKKNREKNNERYRKYDRNYYHEHKEIILERQNKYYNKIKNGIKYKNYYFKRYYGISFDEYNELFEKQNGHCAICGKHQDEFKQAFCVDHNHITGKVRGLLCSKCNSALGLFDDDVCNLNNALDYMRKEETNA